MFWGANSWLDLQHGTLSGPPSPLSHRCFFAFFQVFIWDAIGGKCLETLRRHLPGAWAAGFVQRSMLMLPAQGTQLLSSTLLLFFDHWTALGHHQLGGLARPDSSACTRVTGVNSMVSVVVVPAFVVFHSLNLDRLRSFRVIFFSDSR